MKKLLCVSFAMILCIMSLAAAASAASSAEQRIRDKLKAAQEGTTLPPADDTYTMDDLSWDMLSSARRRTEDEDVYWKVTVDKLECNSDGSSDAEDAVIVSIDLSWDGMNGVPRTKKMLRFFGDDMAQSLFKLYPDVNITQLWCRWTVPYLYDDGGFIAKYKYVKRDDAVYMVDSNGILFSMPDDYK